MADSTFPSISRGLSVPVLTALKAGGEFDAASQEALVEWVCQEGQGADMIFSGGTTGEWHRLPPALLRQANEACHFALPAKGPGLWAGVTAHRLADSMENLEHALKLGAQAAVIAPLSIADAPEPVPLFHQHVLPLFQFLGRSLPVCLYDNAGIAAEGREAHLRTRDLKQLARLDFVFGAKVTAGAKVVGNYLKAARHFKQRDEFGVYLGDPNLAFSIFSPARGPLGGLKGGLHRFWLGRELPAGLVAGGANLFPREWKRAWKACLAGEVKLMERFKAVFEAMVSAWRFDEAGEMVSKPVACMKAALKEEGVLACEALGEGTPALTGAQRGLWLQRYRDLKQELAGFVPAEWRSRGARGGARAAAEAPVPVSRVERTFDLVGVGGAVKDTLCRVESILGPESKGRVLQETCQAGGVILNQLCWASALGLRCALFGLGGDDEAGDFLRRALDAQGVDHQWFLAEGARTATSRIYVDRAGERAIYMDPGATQALRAADIPRFEPLIRLTRFVSTEVSQLRLEACLALLKLAAALGKPVFVDLDIPPSQAAARGGLGTRAQLKRVLEGADHLKTSVSIAAELVPRGAPARMALALHRKLRKKPGRWVALTSGARGAAFSDGGQGIFLPSRKGARALDSTGAGDAFMGGLVAAAALGLGLRDAGQLAHACGAACVRRLGGQPRAGRARREILGLYKGRSPRLPPAPPASLDAGEASDQFVQAALRELGALGRKVPRGYFDAAVRLIRGQEAQGKRLHVTGVGKPEYVAGYIASSFSSTGTPAFFLHATEASHGASGQVAAGDVVIAISNSGETEEIKNAVSTLKKNGARILGVSGRADSWLARQSDAFLFAGVKREGDPLNLAPRASVLAELLVLSGLGVELQKAKQFKAEDFRKFHPGGSLGKVDMEEAKGMQAGGQEGT